MNYKIIRDNELYHHGVKGQQWGEKHGPPYPLDRDKENLTKAKHDYAVNRKEEKVGFLSGINAASKKETQKQNFKDLSDLYTKNYNKYKYTGGGSSPESKNKARNAREEVRDAIGDFFVDKIGEKEGRKLFKERNKLDKYLETPWSTLPEGLETPSFYNGWQHAEDVWYEHKYRLVDKLLGEYSGIKIKDMDAETILKYHSNIEKALKKRYG